MGGKAGAQCVYAPALSKTRSLLRLVIDVLGLVFAQRAILGSVDKKPGRRPVAFPVRAQFHQQGLGQGRVAVLSIFTL